MRMCGSSEKEGGGLWESGGWPGGVKGREDVGNLGLLGSGMVRRG